MPIENEPLIIESNIPKKQVKIEDVEMIPWYEENVLPPRDTVDLFNIVIPVILKNEGSSYVEDKSINEISKMGITLSAYRAYYKKGNKNSIKNLTSEQARCIYRKLFWEKNKLDSISSIGFPKTATVLFDSEINIGPTRANKYLQRSLGMPSKFCTGRIGEQTLGYLRVTKLTDDELCSKILSKRKLYYSRLVKRNAVYAKYHKGWNRRLRHMAKFVKEV